MSLCDSKKKKKSYDAVSTELLLLSLLTDSMVKFNLIDEHISHIKHICSNRTITLSLKSCELDVSE